MLIAYRLLFPAGLGLAMSLVSPCIRAELVAIEEESTILHDKKLVPNLLATSSNEAPSAGPGFPELIVGKMHHLHGNTLEAVQWLLRALKLGRQEAMPILLQYMTDDPSSITGHHEILIDNLRRMAAQGNIIARGNLAYFEATRQFSLQPSATTFAYAEEALKTGNTAGKCAMALLILTGNHKSAAYEAEKLLQEAESAGFTPASELRKKLLKPPQPETDADEPNHENKKPTHRDPYRRVLNS